MKFGADYRRMFPTIGLRPRELELLFDGVSQALTGSAGRVSLFTRPQSQRPIFIDFATYAQDEWRLSPRLTFTYGLRWEVNPAPVTANGSGLRAVKDVSDPARLSLAAPGSRLWSTTYGNFAPRLGLAYQLNGSGDFVVRGSVGVLYDTANKALGDAFAESYPSLDGTSVFNTPFSFSSTLSPSGSTISVPFSAFDPALKLPYSLQWNISIEREVGQNQVISAAYVASANRRLLLTSTLLDPSSVFSFVRLTNNGGQSDYRALQIQFRRRLVNGFSAMAGYTWGKSDDNFSEDSAARALFHSLDSQFERGPADFDVRHSLTGFLSYEPHNLFGHGIGKALFGNWSIDSVFNLHSAGPVNVLYAVPTSLGFLYLRPDVIFDAPLYIADAAAAGGRRINPNAFAIPNDFRQGTLGRNAVRGFPLAQVDLALRRRFNLTENVRLTFGVEFVNILNHPNFHSPDGNEAVLATRFATTSLSPDPTFGQSFTNAARSPWGSAGSTFGSSYYPGGARTLKLSAKFEF